VVDLKLPHYQWQPDQWQPALGNFKSKPHQNQWFASVVSNPKSFKANPEIGRISDSAH
jgi:hypothetical protein